MCKTCKCNAIDAMGRRRLPARYVKRLRRCRPPRRPQPGTSRPALGSWYGRDPVGGPEDSNARFFHSPYLRGLAITEAGVVYAAVNGCRCVVKITPEGKVETVLESERPWSPTGVAAGGKATGPRPPGPASPARLCVAARISTADIPATADTPPPARRAGSAQCRGPGHWPSASAGCGSSPTPSSQSNPARDKKATR